MGLTRQNQTRCWEHCPGLPLAGDAVVSKLEKLLKKRRLPLPIGRPKKKEIDGEICRKLVTGRIIPSEGR